MTKFCPLPVKPDATRMAGAQRPKSKAMDHDGSIGLVRPAWAFPKARLPSPSLAFRWPHQPHPGSGRTPAHAEGRRAADDDSGQPLKIVAAACARSVASWRSDSRRLNMAIALSRPWVRSSCCPGGTHVERADDCSIADRAWISSASWASQTFRNVKARAACTFWRTCSCVGAKAGFPRGGRPA